MDGLNLLLLKAATAPDQSGLSLWRIFGAWLLCIGIAVALILLLRRVRGGRAAGSRPLFPRLLSQSSRQIEIVETRRATMAVDLCVLDYRGDRYLIASGPGGTALLDKSPVPPTPETGAH